MTEREKRICSKYSTRDESGRVHCQECPLVVDREQCLCKANAKYNRKTREWKEEKTRDGKIDRMVGPV
jgi:hypothetical protein